MIMVYLLIVGAMVAMVAIERLQRVVSWIRSRRSDVGVRWRRTIKDLDVMIMRTRDRRFISRCYFACNERPCDMKVMLVVQVVLVSRDLV